MANPTEVYNHLHLAGTVQVQLGAFCRPSFNTLRVQLSKRLRLYTELAGKQYSLGAKFNAETGIATFVLKEPIRGRDYQIVEADVCSDMGEVEQERDSNSAMPSLSSHQDQTSNLQGEEYVETSKGYDRSTKLRQA